MKLHEKLAKLEVLSPDIVIVPESERPGSLKKNNGGSPPTSIMWGGDNEKKGLSVLAFGDYRLRVHESHDPDLKYYLPVVVEGPESFNLLAVWSFYYRLPPALAKNPGKATGSMLRALDHYEAFLRSSPAVMAGDFNDNVRWDKPRGKSNHSGNVARLSEFGLVSSYHSFHRVPQGNEPHPTLYWRDRKQDGPSYHIDYCFIPEEWVSRLTSVKTGDFGDWVPVSDHVPLVVDIARPSTTPSAAR